MNIYEYTTQRNISENCNAMYNERKLPREFYYKEDSSGGGGICSLVREWLGKGVLCCGLNLKPWISSSSGQFHTGLASFG